MIISPPILKAKSATETDAAWISRVMASDVHRGFPVSAAGSWHGGIHIKHTDNSSSPEKVRAIADGKVVSFRPPANDEAKCAEPLNLNGATDNGYVLLKHETEIGSGENGKVVFYSLYMHLKSLNAAIKSDAQIYRKDALGTAGMVDGENAFHFQIFCDDDNIEKITGRKTQKLDITRDGRTDAVYGDIHFVLPVGTKFYNKAPDNNSSAIEGLNELHTSTVPLYVSMTLAKGSCTMVTRQEDANVEGRFFTVGEALIDVDEKEYEYNLYKTAKSRYKNCSSAGYELLRFGRVINSLQEKLVPVDAPLWVTVNYPSGKGVVNIAADIIKKYSDADFPHWVGWQIIDDDKDTNSQCNSGVINKLQDDGLYYEFKDKLICHFPFEWDYSTFDTRFSWLKTVSDIPMKEDDYDKFKKHVDKLCFDGIGVPSGNLWSFNPLKFIEHFRKCNWFGESDYLRSIRQTVKNKTTLREEGKLTKEIIIDYLDKSESNSSGEVIRPESLKESMSFVMRNYGLNSPARMSHFLSQIYCETGRFNECIEKGGVTYFKKYEPSWDTKKKQTNALAKTLGNDQVGDGVRFKGRGIIQLTGRANYKLYGSYKGDESKFLSDDGSKSMIASAYFCCDAGGFYWVQKQRMKLKDNKLVNWGSLSINYWADQGTAYNDVKAVTKCVNGGDHGLDDIRWPCFEHAFYALNDEVLTNRNFKPLV